MDVLVCHTDGLVADVALVVNAQIGESCEAIASQLLVDAGTTNGVAADDVVVVTIGHRPRS